MNRFSSNNGTIQFCDTPFWDSHLFWDSSSPQFSSCFCHSILSLIPFFTLILIIPYDMYFVRKKWKNNSPPILWNWRICIVLPVILVSIVLSGTQLIRSLVQFFTHDVQLLSVIFSSGIQFISYILMLISTMIFHRSNLIMSASQPMFWLMNIISSLVNIWSLSHRENLNDFDISFNAITISISTIGLIVSCISDLESPYECLSDDDTHDDDDDYCPVRGMNLFSRLTFFWVYKLLFLGFKVKLDHNVHFKPLCSFMRSGKAAEEFQKAYEKCNSNAVKTRMVPVVLRTSWIPFLVTLILNFVDLTMSMAQPLLIGKLLDFVAGSKDQNWHGLFYAITYCMCAFAARAVSAEADTLLEMSGIRIKSAMISSIYSKMLRLSPSARRKYTAGEINNLMGVDTQEIINFIGIMSTMIVGPIKIIVALYIIWQNLGPSALTLIGVMIIISPITAWIMNKTDKMWTEQMKLKDKRMEQISEILNNIKLLKLFAWEKPFMDRVTETRQKEVRKMLIIDYWSSAIDVIWSMSPMLVAAACFTVYVLSSSGVLDAKVAFVSLSVFNIMRPSMAILPMVLVKLMRANVSSKRIREFLDAEEVSINPNRTTLSSAFDDDFGTISIDNGTFTWDLSEEPVLKDIKLTIKKGSLTAIVGKVGCGKSSLFSALMGDMYQTKGTPITMSGSLAYVPQSAWIQNCTLKQNIVFTSHYDEERYKNIISSCALESDLEILPARDETEIGEKGVNLSGGQKQRVSLARAVYQDADIYFLDDPLSAVDAHVAHQLFHRVIGPNALLDGKTRLLATHHVSFLKNVDAIIVIKDGEIIGNGKYEELSAKGLLIEEVIMSEDLDKNDVNEAIDEETEENNPLIKRQISSNMVMRQRSILSETSDTSARFRRQFSHQSGASSNKEELTTKEKREREANIGQLIDEEQQEMGTVKFSDYISYIKQCGILIFAASFITEFGFNACEVGANYWLNLWSSKSMNQTSSQRNIYLSVYTSSIIAEALLIICGNVLIFIGALRASSQMHKDMLFSVLRTPLSFFDVTPIGRILNRFNRDIAGVDEDVPYNFKFVLQQYLMFPLVIAIVVSLSGYMVIMIAIVTILFYLTYKLYVWTSRHLKRLESVTRSPVYSHFTESISGAVSIRAYQAQEEFIRESNNRVDINQNCCWMQYTTQQWLEIWTGFGGAIVTFTTSCYVVIHRDDISPGMAGLVLVYAVMIVDCLNWAVRVSTWLENNMVSVERIREYSQLQSEADWDSNDSVKPNALWPNSGRIDFRNYTTSYRPELDPVIRNLNLTINGGEKIGIVGRTGAGKSSMTLALFRMIEPTHGKIIIDGVDVTKIGLHDLRSKLTIIPQEPSLFAGPLRLNLDPFDEYSDEKLWTSLQDAHLKEFISSLPDGLQHTIAEGGDNLSAGQRQLICLARALLRNTRILVLDEATAACDMETDQLIQATIREKFSKSTIVTIAHRLNTVMDYDRILVLSQGKLMESGSPQQLLTKKDSIFYGLAKEAGIVIE